MKQSFMSLSYHTKSDILTYWNITSVSQTRYSYTIMEIPDDDTSFRLMIK